VKGVEHRDEGSYSIFCSMDWGGSGGQHLKKICCSFT